MSTPMVPDNQASPSEAVTPTGRFRIYLGAAPGVGKTYAMVSEGHRRRERGTDVVIGLVESHGRPPGVGGGPSAIPVTV